MAKESQQNSWVMWEKRIWHQSHNQPHKGQIQRQV